MCNNKPFLFSKSKPDMRNFLVGYIQEIYINYEHYIFIKHYGGGKKKRKLNIYTLQKVTFGMSGMPGIFWQNFQDNLLGNNYD